MTYQIFNVETGTVSELKKKKTKRTEPFFMMTLKVTEKIAQIKNLHGTEYKVFLFLLSKMDFENRAMLTQSYVSQQLDMPQSQISTAIKTLSDCGVLRKVSIAGQNGYMINDELVSRK